MRGPDGPDGPDGLEVGGRSARDIGRAAAGLGVALTELTPRQASLEEAFMELTRDAVEYRTPRTAGAARTGDGA